MPSFRKSLIVEQFQGNYLKGKISQKQGKETMEYLSKHV